MKLFIARHGQASFDAPSDSERPLTELGLKQTRDLFQLNKSLFEGVEELWCSDLVRAKQTAQVFESGLALEAQSKRFLSPDGDVRKVIREIQKSEASHLLIVSHQPLVGELVSTLIEGNPYQAHPYTTSEVLVLEMEMIEPGLASLVSDLIPV